MTLLEFLQLNSIEYKESVSLKDFTGMNLQGQIPIVAFPSSIESLTDLYIFLKDSLYTYEVVGGMTNTYFCSNIKRDIVVKTVKIKSIQIEDESIIVGCGYSLSKFSKEMVEQGISGFEGLVGIPGTVGAAAINNSGAFGYDISGVVKELLIIDNNGKKKTLHKDQLCYSSRYSVLKRQNFGIILTVTFDSSKKASSSILKSKVSRFTEIRRNKIDGKRKSLGSTITSRSLNTLWENHKMAFFLKKILYFPFKYTKCSKEAKCWLDFFVLGIPHLSKHCDSIGRFCWTADTKEKDFFEYMELMKKISHNNVEFEIEIKK